MQHIHTHIAHTPVHKPSNKHHGDYMNDTEFHGKVDQMQQGTCTVTLRNRLRVRAQSREKEEPFPSMA